MAQPARDKGMLHAVQERRRIKKKPLGGGANDSEGRSRGNATSKDIINRIDPKGEEEIHPRDENNTLGGYNEEKMTKDGNKDSLSAAEKEWGLLMAIMDYLESIGHHEYETTWELAHRIFKGIKRAMEEEDDEDIQDERR